MDKFLFIGIGVILLIIGLVLFVKPNTVPATQVRDAVLPASVVMIILGLAAVAYPSLLSMLQVASGASMSEDLARQVKKSATFSS